MQSDYQSPESPAAAIEGTYSYTETAGRSLERLHRPKVAPSEYFRYRVVKRCLDIFLILISMPVMLLLLGVVSLVVRLSSPDRFFILTGGFARGARSSDVEVPYDVREFGRGAGGLSGTAP